jgi:membrane-bound ClpP family serine protease
VIATGLLAAAQAVPADAPNDIYLLWGVILAGVAVGLLVLELFVPSGGLIGVLCGVAAIGSIVAFFQFDTTLGVVALVGYVLLGPLLIYMIFKLWLNSPIGKLMILGGTEEVVDEQGDALPASEAARRERKEKLRQLIGAEGTTVTALRPVGTVRIAGQRLDALAETGVIEANTPVIVTDVYDNQIKVRPR